MNDDYLWDRTGEPDPEIQQLEKVLGTLRYQPRPLEIPVQRTSWFKPSLRRGYATRWAIAATIAVMLLGLGLWLGLQRSQPIEVAKTQHEHPPVKGTVETVDGSSIKNTNGSDTENNEKGAVAVSVGADKKRAVRAACHDLSQKMFARDTRRTPRSRLNTPELAVTELREAEAAKVQLMLALRVASSKLNFAQKKTQGTSTENVIHNQHKIG